MNKKRMKIIIIIAGSCFHFRSLVYFQSFSFYVLGKFYFYFHFHFRDYIFIHPSPLILSGVVGKKEERKKWNVFHFPLLIVTMTQFSVCFSFFGNGSHKMWFIRRMVRWWDNHHRQASRYSSTNTPSNLIRWSGWRWAIDRARPYRELNIKSENNFFIFRVSLEENQTN